MDEIITKGRPVGSLICQACKCKILQEAANSQLQDKTLYLYKYVPVHAAELIIRQRLLKFMSPKNANDPFEFMPQHTEGMSEQDLNTIIYNSPFVVTCFSLSCHTPAMWGHYADNGKGVCLGFKITDFEAKFLEKDDSTHSPFVLLLKKGKDQEYIVPVQYSHERSKFVRSESDVPHLLAASTKDISWKYEQEYRIAKTADSGMKVRDGSYFAASIVDCLHSIILSPKCELDEQYFRCLLSQNGFSESISIIRAQYNKNRYCFDTPGYKDNLQDSEGNYLEQLPKHIVEAAIYHSSLIKKVYLGSKRLK